MVSRYRVIALLSVAALALAGYCLADESPASKPAEKITFTRQLVAGMYVQTSDSVIDQVFTMDKRTTAGRVETTEVVTFDVSEPDSGGNRKVIMRFRRVKAASGQGDTRKVFDSAGPADQQDPDMAKGLGQLTKATITITMGPDGRARSVVGLDAMWDDLARSHPDTKTAMASMKKTLGDDAIRKVVDNAAEVLPDKPVALGSQWFSTLRFALQSIGEVSISATNAFTRAETEGKSRFAVIEYAGATEDTKGPTSGPVGAEAKEDLMGGQVTRYAVKTKGIVRVDLANQMLTTVKATREDEMEVSYPGLAARGMYKTTWTTTVEVKPDTEATTQPAK